MAKDQGYIKLPRDLLTDPDWLHLPSTYQNVFITIFRLAAFEDRKFNVFGNEIKLKPGQLCISLRSLADECAKDVNKRTVERALEQFAKIKIAGHETGQNSRHKKTIITITHPTICKYFEKENQTTKGTVGGTVEGQSRDTKKEYKNLNISSSKDSDISDRHAQEPKIEEKILTFGQEEGIPLEYQAKFTEAQWEHVKKHNSDFTEEELKVYILKSVGYWFEEEKLTINWPLRFRNFLESVRNKRKQTKEKFEKEKKDFTKNYKGAGDMPLAKKTIIV